MNRSRPVTAAVGVIAVAALVTACGAGGRSSDDETSASAEPVVGVTDDTVTIGGHFPLTGVAAPGYSEIPTGAKAYFDYVNAAGGVNGRDIEFIAKDDGYDPTNTAQVTNELLQQDEIFAMVGGLGTPTHGAVVDTLNQEEVPDLFVSSGALQWGNDPSARPYTFGWQPDYEVEGKILGKYVADNFPDAKVGLYIQGDDFGRDGEKGARHYLDDQIVTVQKYTPGNTDVAPQIAALKSSGADVIVGFNVPSYTALAKLVSLKLKYDPTWVFSSVAFDAQLVGGLLGKFSEGAVKDGQSLLTGMYVARYLPGVEDTDSPWTQLWQKVWDEQGGDGQLTNFRIYGMSWAYTFVQALQAAGENPTRDGIVEALEAQGKDFEGPALAPYRYGPDSHLGISGVQVVENTADGIEAQTKVEVSDIGDADVTEDESAAGDAPPESGIPDESPAS
jgi:branched-chain amino acid transport system substrate-binding protein